MSRFASDVAELTNRGIQLQDHVFANRLQQELKGRQNSESCASRGNRTRQAVFKGELSPGESSECPLCDEQSTHPMLYSTSDEGISSKVCRTCFTRDYSLQVLQGAPQDHYVDHRETGHDLRTLPTFINNLPPPHQTAISHAIYDKLLYELHRITTQLSKSTSTAAGRVMQQELHKVDDALQRLESRYKNQCWRAVTLTVQEWQLVMAGEANTTPVPPEPSQDRPGVVDIFYRARRGRLISLRLI